MAAEEANEFSDVFKEFDPMFANCNNCGDTGLITKTCWCGGTFDPPARTEAWNVPFFRARPNFSLTENGKITGSDGEMAESHC